ncbi:hypothetical protein KUV50_15495 [Membranicola marinus]|uniref:Uncharacterized protein n=1 Tax=Membranihabitans marinus TaxID=1227546 RepID=A0A953HWQ2_9BACT|nr:hypothetical protein [Membranihabitans marinus]MBY5959556.1 hypothetical protein [Membranihabitans marinus]
MKEVCQDEFGLDNPALAHSSHGLADPRIGTGSGSLWVWLVHEEDYRAHILTNIVQFFTTNKGLQTKN